MSEKDPRPESHATQEQVQAVVDEVDRVTKNVKASPGHKDMKNHSAPSRTRWQNGVLFFRYPEGQGNVDDPDSINLAAVAWDNPDGSRTSYSVELTIEHGLQLSKHTYPPSDGQVEARSRASIEALDRGDWAIFAVNATADLASAERDRDARIQERALGLHIASATEAAKLIAKLQQIEPAPK